MIVSSNDYLIWVDSVQVPNVQNVSMSFSISTVEVTTMRTEGFRESIPDTRTVTISFDALLDPADLERFELGDNINLRFGTMLTSFVTDGYITSLEQSGGTDDVPTYSVTAETTGDVTEFVRFALAELCTTEGQPICTTAGEIICVAIAAQVLEITLKDHNGDDLLDSLGEPITTIVRIT